MIGPFPERIGDDEESREQYDRLRRRLLWAMPYGLYVLGSRAGDERNLMTINWVTQVAFEPKLIGVGVEKTAFTHRLVADGGTFTLNLISREDRPIVRRFTKPCEWDAEASTLNGFAVHESSTGTPILDQAVGFVDCRVTQPVDCGGHTFFIGEVVDADFQLAEDTPILRMEDTRMSYGG